MGMLSSEFYEETEAIFKNFNSLHLSDSSLSRPKVCVILKMALGLVSLYLGQSRLLNHFFKTNCYGHATRHSSTAHLSAQPAVGEQF